MKPLDYTLYNKVKEKFLPQPGNIIFISLKDENLKELCGIAFTVEEAQSLWSLCHEHAMEASSYAIVGGFSEEAISYEFYCQEFEQEEDLSTGQIIKLSVGTYHNHPINIEAVKKDLSSLKYGAWLEGNA